VRALRGIRTTGLTLRFFWTFTGLSQGHAACGTLDTQRGFFMITGRTVGAAVGALLFVLFFAFISGRLIVPASASEQQVAVNLR
jgi:hypothetical protein